MTEPISLMECRKGFEPLPNAPWDWNLYLYILSNFCHENQTIDVNCTSHMDPLGVYTAIFFNNSRWLDTILYRYWTFAIATLL